MLYYLLFWMFMGFIIHLYIIFWTNLLTQSPVPVYVFFAYFRVSKKRKIKRSPIDLKLHGTHFWKERSPEDLECTSGTYEEVTRQGGVPSTLVGPSCPPLRTSSAYISPYTLKTSESTIDQEFRRQKPL